LASGEGSLWVSTTDAVIYRIDPTSQQVTASIPGVGGHPGAAIAVGFGSVWAAGTGTARIDPASNSIVATWPDLDFAPGNAQIAVGEGLVCILGFQGGQLFRIDPGTNQQVGSNLSVFGGEFGSMMTVGSGAVWQTGPGFAPVIAEIDPQAGT